MSGLEIVVDDDEIAVGTWGEILVGLLRANASVRSLELLEEAEQALIVREKRIYSVTVVPEMQVKPMGGDVRAKAVELSNRFGPSLDGIAVVIEGGGFGASMTRSIVTGIGMIASMRGVQMRTFDRVSEALAWIASQRRAGMATADQEAIVAAVDALRQ